jgi:ADP-ribose pyrophosphatase
MIEDKPAHPVIHETRTAYAGHRPMDVIRLTPPGGEEQTREVVRAGRVAAVIAYDPSQDALVMLHQFRLAAHLANGLGDVVEIVAGRVEAGEDITEAARRECQEEIGLEPKKLVKLFTYLPSPGYTDEETTVFLAEVNALDAPETAGLPDEGESTKPIVVSRTAAMEALDSGKIHNGLTLTALYWIARHGERLAGLLAP